MSQKPRYQTEYEGERAVDYDARRVTDRKWGLEQAAVADFLALCAEAPAEILDVPVGTGRFVELYSERGDRVLGIDVSQDMLDQAAEKIREISEAQVELRIGDISDLTLPTDSFDVIVCVRLFNLIDSGAVSTALEELARVTRQHVIVGVRAHGTRGWMRRVARRTRAWALGRPLKLFIHDESWWRDVVGSVGATVVERRLISEGAHNSGDYHLYLLSLSEQT